MACLLMRYYKAYVVTADSGNDGDVRVTELAAYLDTEVPKITKQIFQYEQFPMYDLQGQAFPLSMN